MGKVGLGGFGHISGCFCEKLQRYPSTLEKIGHRSGRDSRSKTQYAYCMCVLYIYIYIHIHIHMCIIYLYNPHIMPNLYFTKGTLEHTSYEKIAFLFTFSHATGVAFLRLPSAFGSITILSTSVDARWNGTCWSSIHGCLLLCTRLFCHIPFLFWKGLNASRKRILVHHVMVILVYGTGLLKGSMHFWGAAAGLCEFSNMFLANIELVKCCSNMHQLKQSLLYKLNSAFLSLAYICCRLVLFPAVLAALLTDAYTHPELTVRSSMVEWVMMPMSICCVWAMSAFEFRNIFEGTFKATK